MIWYLSGQFAAKGLAVAPMLYSEEYLAWGIQRTDPQLLNEVNAFLEKIRQNGELTVILTQWLPGYQEN
jgi:ABC-type amino acid transport substrate-binding protein